MGGRAIWLVVAAVAVTGSPKFQDAQKNDLSSYQPGSAESSRALAATDRISGGHEITPAVVVFERDTRLTAADLRADGGRPPRLNAELPAAGIRGRSAPSRRPTAGRRC